MATEKAGRSSGTEIQASFLFSEPIGKRVFDNRIDSYRIIYAAEKTVEAPPKRDQLPTEVSKTALRGVSLSMKDYYEQRERMVRAVVKANQIKTYLPQPESTAGHAEYVDGLQKRMDELFLVDELIAAGFTPDAVKQASRQNTTELQETYAGPRNEKARTKEYGYLNQKIESFSE